MSRKFSIVATVDLSKIKDEIEKYIQTNGNLDPYIFMNEDTIRAIENEIGADDVVVSGVDLPNKRNTKNGMYATYCGCKVFINNDLRFGIVEIR